MNAILCFILGHQFVPLLERTSLETIEDEHGQLSVRGRVQALQCARCGKKKPVKISWKNMHSIVIGTATTVPPDDHANLPSDDALQL